MSSQKTSGVLIAHQDYSTFDELKFADCVVAKIKKENQEIVDVRIPVGARFRIGLDNDFWRMPGLTTSDVLLLDHLAVNAYRRSLTDSFKPLLPNEQCSPSNIFIRAAVGDLITVKWDYETFIGEIVGFAINRVSMPHILPKNNTENLGHIGDLLSSYSPKQNE